MCKSPEKPSSKTGSTDFLIRIQYRQNASWQGEIEWLGEQKKRFFRSLLELITLMQGALEKEGTVEPDAEFHSWNDEDR